MKTPAEILRLKDYLFPREVVAYAVWAYHRFALSAADVEDLLAEHGVTVSRENLREWVNRFLGISPAANHWAHEGLNNRIKGSHRPARKREKVMGRFISIRKTQRFLAAHDQTNTMFRPRRYSLSTVTYRHVRSDTFDLWHDYALEMNARENHPWGPLQVSAIKLAMPLKCLVTEPHRL